MELEKFIIKRILETTSWGWILTLDGDIIDVIVPENEDLKTAEGGIRFMIEVLIKEPKYEARAVKYKLWNRSEELSGISYPEQKTKMISLDEALHYGGVPMHKKEDIN